MKMESPLLSAKAEVIFGIILVARNRATRLTCALALVTGAVLSVQEVERFPGAHQPLTAFLIAGTLAAVAGSRLFAPGGEFAASRHVAAAWWLVPIGRLTGALLVVLPVAAVPVVAIELSNADPLLLGLSVTVFAASVASFCLSLAPAVGSSAAATAAILFVWSDTIPSTAIREGLEALPWAREAAFLLWNTLPLPWRAERILTLGSSADAVTLLCWVAVGIAAIGWATTTTPLTHRKRS